MAQASERDLREDVLLMVFAKLLVLIFGAATTVILARSLGPAGRGSLASTYALMTLLAQLGTLGIASANPYFAAREPQIRDSIAGNSLWLAGVLGPLMAAVGIALKLGVPATLGNIGWTELSVGMFAVPIMLSSLFLQSISLAEGRTVLYNGTEVGGALLTVLLLLIALPLAGGGVLAALSLMVGPQVAVLAVYLLAMRSRYAGLLRRPDTVLIRRMLGYGARAYLVTLLTFALIRVDLLLVNAIQGERAAGQYSIAVALADALYLLPLSAAINLFARVARGSADRAASLGVLHLVAFGYLLLCMLAAALSGPTITLLFGAGYRPAIDLFLWLLPGVYCLGVLTVIAYHFAAEGMPRELVFVWLPGLAVNLTINVALLPHHGTYVASIASTVAYAMVLILHLRLFAREVGGWSALRPTVSGTTSLVRVALRRA